MLFCVISYSCPDKKWGPNRLHHWLILNKCLKCTFNLHKLRWFTDVEKIRFYPLFLLSLKTKSSLILFSFTIAFSSFFSCKLFPLELKVEYVIIYMLIKGTGMEGFPPPKKIFLHIRPLSLGYAVVFQNAWSPRGADLLSSNAVM